MKINELKLATLFAIDSHILAWSNSQKSFHIETVAQMLIENRQYFAHNRSDCTMDWIVMWIGTHAECNAMADFMETWPKPKRRKAANNGSLNKNANSNP